MLNPVVVSSQPIAGKLNVSADVTEIRVKFSHDMQTEKMWSVMKINNTHFPKITSTPYYERDKRTFVLPVKLESNKLYAIGINSPNKTGFRSVEGQSAQPYTISFKTGQ